MRYSITRPAKRIVAGLISVRYLKGQITTVDSTDVLSHTITISSNLIGALTALSCFPNHSVGL